jgi:hypothetical protein
LQDPGSANAARQALLAFLSLAVVLLCPCARAADYPQTIDLAISSPDVTILGAYTSGHAGSSIAVGDFNGDNFVDLAIVACNARPLGGTREGEVTIAWGPASTWGNSLDLATESAVSRIIGPPDGDVIYCKITIGDFNGDGFDDLLWGQPASPGYSWVGRVFMIPGSSEFPDTVDVADPLADVVVITGHAWLGSLGDGLGACDFDGDGMDEIVMAATYIPNAEIYLLKGTATFQKSYSTALPEPGMSRFIDPEENRGTGRAMTSGDIDGDLREELILGARGNGAGTQDGKVTIIYGSAEIPASFVLSGTELRTKRIMPEYSHGFLGQSLELGDTDRDGKWDLTVSAYGADPLGCENCGEVYVVHDIDGVPDTLAIASQSYLVQRLLGAGSSTWHGIRVRLGDFDGDGWDDLLIANSTDQSTERAQVMVAHGALVGSDTVMLATDITLTRVIERVKTTHLGWGMELADLNHDGWDDIILGAERASPPGRGGAGEVYIFFGCGIVTNGGSPPPAEPAISPGHPNPFNSTVTFDYTVPERSTLRITVFDVRGRRVVALAPRYRSSAGSVTWDGKDDRGRRVPSGTYFLRMESGAYALTRKVVLLR